MNIDLHIMAKAAASALLKPTDVATIARKAAPTQNVGSAVNAIGAVRKAVTTGAPVRASADVLEHLMHAPGAALGFIGKYAGIADREYMRGGQAAGGAAKSVFDKLKEQGTARNAIRFGLPAAYGGLSGAEQVPENRLLGALGGAGGAVAGSELGGHLGRGAARSMNAGPVGENIGELLGRLMGSGMGQDLGIRGTRLLVT